MPQRWLILTSSTGSGHDTRAYALRDWADRILGDQVEVAVWHVLEETSFLGRFGVWLYNQIQRHWPALHQIFWQITEVWNFVNFWFVRCFGRDIRRRFKKERPHLVISMHDSLNAAYFEAARRALGRDKVRCVTYCGEWSSGFGFSHHWVDPTVDLFIARTAEVASFAQSRGVPLERTRVFRDLMRLGDFDERFDAAQRAFFRKHELGLNPERFTVLLASGALGADRHQHMLDALQPLGDRVQAIALCGRNERARWRVEAWARAHPEFHVCVLGFTHAIPRLFQASDCVVTRGGSNTMAECVHFQRPLLFHAERGIMPQECCTRRFLIESGIGHQVTSRGEMREMIQRWIDRPEDYAEVVDGFKRLDQEEHPRQLVDILSSLTSELR